MASAPTRLQARAVYHDGMLTLLDPLSLPYGAEVNLDIALTPTHKEEQLRQLEVLYPTHTIKVQDLQRLVGLVGIGGDALLDSEALYDSD